MEIVLAKFDETKNLRVFPLLKPIGYDINIFKVLFLHDFFYYKISLAYMHIAWNLEKVIFPAAAAAVILKM